MDNARLTFAPIDLERHADLCAQFRADSFRVSFGSDERVYQEHATSPTTVHPDGRGRAQYVTWLAQRMREFPGSCVHVWHHDAVVGQIEMGRFRGDASVGYVNLFYLIPAYRGHGLGAQLEQYALAFLRRTGYQRVRLSVSATNPQAIAFYLKHHWQDLGPRADHPDSHYMEKRLTGTATAPTAERGGSRGERPDAVAEAEGQGSTLKE
jgi:GNAT superfamily N-acetyltransferase